MFFTVYCENFLLKGSSVESQKKKTFWNLYFFERKMSTLKQIPHVIFKWKSIFTIAVIVGTAADNDVKLEQKAPATEPQIWTP